MQSFLDQISYWKPFDFETCDQPMTIKRTYIVCATQRSGSTLLCHLLTNTNKVGHPKEYLLPTHNSKVSFDEDNYLQYVCDSLEAHASEEGITGVKIMDNHFLELLERLHSSKSSDTKSDLETLCDVFPAVKFIFVTRENKLRQAISLARAEQSNQWEKHSSSSCSIEKQGKFSINPFYIKSAIKRATEREDIWKKFFRENSITPYTITYEDLVKAQSLHTQRVLEFLEISDAFKIVVAPSILKKQADFYTEFLIVYYRVYFFLNYLFPKLLWNVMRHIKNHYFCKVSRAE